MPPAPATPCPRAANPPFVVDGPWAAFDLREIQRRLRLGDSVAAGILVRFSQASWLTGLGFELPAVGQSRQLRLLRESFGWRCREVLRNQGVDILPWLRYRETGLACPPRGWLVAAREEHLEPLIARWEQSGLRPRIGRQAAACFGGYGAHRNFLYVT